MAKPPRRALDHERYGAQRPAHAAGGGTVCGRQAGGAPWRCTGALAPSALATRTPPGAAGPSLMAAACSHTPLRASARTTLLAAEPAEQPPLRGRRRVTTRGHL